jgi:hypothetical protein
MNTDGRLTKDWAIDGHIFKDPDTAHEYIFYSHLYGPKGAGITYDKLLSPVTVANTPVAVTYGSEAWEDKTGDPNDGSLRYTNEGPTVLKRNGKYHVQYSGGSWDLPTYSMGYTVSDIFPTSNGTLFQKFVPPILRSTPLVEGTGHNGMTKSPNMVDDICVYHARVVPFLDSGTRLPFIDRLYWNHNRQFMQSPTLAVQSPPDWPLFSSVLRQNDATMWDVESGEWQFSSEISYDSSQLRVSASKDVSRISPKHEPLTDYLFEVNLKKLNGDEKWKFGISAFSTRESNVNVWIKSDSTVQIEELFRGVTIHSIENKFGWDASVYHQLAVRKTGNLFQVIIDDQNYQKLFATNISKSSTKVAIQAVNLSADFAGVSVTPFMQDTFETTLSSYWNVVSGNWSVHQGSLQETSKNGAILRGDPALNYEFSVDIKWIDNNNEHDTAGIIASSAENEIITAGFENNIWPFGQFVVQRIASGKVQERYQAQLPRGFLYDIYHNIRVIKQGGQFTFYLDSQEVIAHIFVGKVAAPGLYTNGARASFDNVILKRIIIPQNLVLNDGFESHQWNDGYTEAVQGNPWKLIDKGRPNYCCAHSGLNRLIVSDGEGGAEQTVSLEKGEYRMVVFAINNCDGEDCHVELRASTTKKACKDSITRGGRWTKCEMEFAVTSNDSTTIGLFARATSGLIAFDDVMVYRYK